MALEFKLPDIGEGIAEGEIVKWLVNAGNQVKEHQSIVEVMTDKATVEIPAPAAGKIVELRAKEGDTVPVGSVIFVLDTAAGGAQPSQKPGAPAAKDSSAPAHSAPQSNAPTVPAPASIANGTRQQHVPARMSHSGETQSEAGGLGSTLEFKLPDIGEGIAEGEIVKWLVKAGEQVQEHQSIVEVMTDKATVEIPAPAAGLITRILAQEGQVVPVGTVIFHLAGTSAARTAARTSKPAAEPAQASTAKLPRAGMQTPAAGNTTRAPSRESLGQRVGAAAAVSAATSQGRERVLAVPSARRLARELGVDLSSIPGSGRNGVVRRADVEGFAREATPIEVSPRVAPAAPARPQHAPIAVVAGERETRTPFRGVRRKIAEAMVRSKFTAPHFTVVEEVDVTELVLLREKAKAIGAESGVKVTFMPFIMKATALALAKYPMLNGRLDEAAQELVRFQYVDLGIAMDTDNGLIVPVVRDVQAKGILQLATELNELAERTRAGKVRPEELRNSTFSITNAGNIGGIFATPIINFPDIAILGVHRIVKRPGVLETPQGDRIEVRQYMNFSCSVDHRLADGADGARFLVYVKKLLENPGLIAL